ncbi:MAG: efflux RND transporter periplasmic adaptor subunit [Phocaeicola sp.]|nr:efflux RND transporter periplasmic adaptor subunit [Phocaeicola sp.]
MTKVNWKWALLATVIVLSSCGKNGKQQTKAPIRVKVETVRSMDAREGQSYVGMVEEREATAVSFTSMGTVRRVYVSEGQIVQRGQLLAEMDDTQAKNMLTSAEAMMNQANDAYQRYGMLHENGSLPEVKWVEIESKVAQAKSQLAMAQKNINDCRLTAPVSGVIGRKMISAGETAVPSQAVVTILDINTVKVKVSMPENEMGSIHENTPSIIQVEAANKELIGGRIEKGVQADPLTHTYDIRIHVENKERSLLPGMVANVTFQGKEHGTSLLTLPVTSVQRMTDGSLFVWTVDKAKAAHRTTIQVGTTIGNRITVRSGLEPDQQVVVEGYQKLSEGTNVIY